MKSGSRTLKLLESGVIFAAIGFLATIIHNLFQIVLSRLFVNTPGEFGLMNSTVNLMDQATQQNAACSFCGRHGVKAAFSGT